jgi:hypothetical protein
MRPQLQRLDQRLLHHIFGKLQMAWAEDAGQRGQDTARLMAEQVVDEFAGFH